MNAKAWLLTGMSVGTLIMWLMMWTGAATGTGSVSAAQQEQARAPKILYGRAVLRFEKGETYEREQIQLPENTFAEQPAIVVSESGSAGSWVIVKAEDVKLDSFAVAGLRDPAGKNTAYQAQVAWIAVGRPSQ